MKIDDVIVQAMTDNIVPELDLLYAQKLSIHGSSFNDSKFIFSSCCYNWLQSFHMKINYWEQGVVTKNGTDVLILFWPVFIYMNLWFS